ncbi:unnamed protein product, partial [Prorocentrum cordatum]
GFRADAVGVWWMRRPPEDNLHGKLYLDATAVEPSCGSLRRAGWSMVQGDDSGNLISGVYGSVRRDLCPRQTAEGGEDLAVWMRLNYAGPVVEEVNADCSFIVSCIRKGRAHAAAPDIPDAHLWGRIHAAFEPGAFAVRKVPARCSRRAALGGPLARAQRRGKECADRLAKLGARLRAVGDPAMGERRAPAEVVHELARWIGQATVIWQGVAAKDSEGPPGAEECRRVRFEEPSPPRLPGRRGSGGPEAKWPRLASARAAAKGCAAAVGAGAELVACSKFLAYAVLGGRSGAKPRLEEACVGGEADESGRSQRGLRARWLHPGGRPRQSKQRQKGQGPPRLRLQGAVPKAAQERYMQCLGTQ